MNFQYFFTAIISLIASFIILNDNRLKNKYKLGICLSTLWLCSFISIYLTIFLLFIIGFDCYSMKHSILNKQPTKVLPYIKSQTFPMLVLTLIGISGYIAFAFSSFLSNELTFKTDFSLSVIHKISLILGPLITTIILSKLEGVTTAVYFLLLTETALLLLLQTPKTDISLFMSNILMPFLATSFLTIIPNVLLDYYGYQVLKKCD